MWKKFNDLIRYCPEYHRNEKLKVDKFQRMLHDDIREVISLFKCTTSEDILSRARLREEDLLRKKNKETKRKLDFVDRDAKNPKQDQSRRNSGFSVEVPIQHTFEEPFCPPTLLTPRRNRPLRTKLGYGMTYFQVVPQLISRIDSLETDSQQTK
ncbi:hypothetical protein Tco_0175622 [Tanacetum coccineum]